MAAFMGGAVSDSRLDIMAAALLQFHNGIPLDPGAPVSTKHYSPDLFWHAYARGLVSTGVFMKNSWDFWPYVEKPLTDFLSELRISTEGRMVAIGDPWKVKGQRSDVRAK